MPGEAIVPLRWLVPWGLRGARPGRLVKYDPFGHTHDTYMYMVGSNGLVPFGDCFVVCLVGVLIWFIIQNLRHKSAVEGRGVVSLSTLSSLSLLSELRALGLSLCHV